MGSLANGQCAHRWPGAGRCLELATTTKPLDRPAVSPMTGAEVSVVYEIPLCEYHAGFFVGDPARV